MRPLAPTLFDRRFDDFVKLGLSKLPALAPDWTDHNAHDPGITLIELLAWVAEAQLYSIGRTRKDERLAYAALMGVEPHGTRPARGLVWPDHTDPSSPAETFAGTRVVDVDAAMSLEKQDVPVLRPERKVLWVPGRITQLSWRNSNGLQRDLTASNERGMPFFPFGESAGQHDLLDLAFETRSEEGLFPTRRKDAGSACWILGILAADPDGLAEDGETMSPRTAPPSVSLVTDANTYLLRIVEDTTGGLLRTGALSLDISNVLETPTKFRLELRAPRGFARPPRWRRIEPNVIPVTERARIDREPHEANGQPDFRLDLDESGLCFEPGAEQPLVEVQGDTGFEEWRRCDRLSEQGPSDPAYELDAQRGRLLFGNGINGRKPGPGAQIYVTYSVSSGPGGNITANRRWTGAGFGRVFGINPAPITGGAGQSDSDDLRRVARRRSSEDHALVTAADIVDAARAIPLLEVARAWVVPQAAGTPRLGTVNLIAMRSRPGGNEPAAPPETTRWLEAVRKRMTGRMPLGTRLVVTAPRYAVFSLRADVEVGKDLDPDEVRAEVIKKLEEELALTGSPLRPEPREPGIPVGRPDVAAWILAVDGVERVLRLELVQEGQLTQKVKVQAEGLPKIDWTQSQISTARSTNGSRP